MRLIGCKTCQPTESHMCESCIEGYFYDYTSLICVACSDVCVTSSSAKDYSICKINYYLLEDQVCVLCGQVGTNCATGCRTCTSPDMAPSCIVCFVAGFLTCSPANKCDTCEIGYYLENNICFMW